MAPLQPVGPYQPNPVTLVNRVGRDARRRDDPHPGKEDESNQPPAADPGAGEAPQEVAAPPAVHQASHATPDPLDPDAPGHLFDLKA